MLRKQAELDAVVMRTLTSLFSALKTEEAEEMRHRILQFFVAENGAFEWINKRFSERWLANDSESSISFWPEGKNKICLAALQYFCAQLQLLDLFDKELKEQIIQKYGLFGAAMSQLKRLGGERGEEQAKILLIEVLTQLLVACSIEVIR